MTAKEARAQAEDITSGKAALQLGDINRGIEGACKEGRFSINISEWPMDSVLQELKNRGFEVRDSSGFGAVINTITISW